MAVREDSLTGTDRDTRSAIPLPRALDETLRLAEIVIKSGLALGHRTKESVVIVLQLGAELGFTPMQSLRTIAVIGGRPVPSADGCVAAVTASDQCEYFREVETTDTHSTWETQRRGDAQPRRFTFTIDDARRAGLILREHWQAYPKRMLAARAKTSRRTRIRTSSADSFPQKRRSICLRHGRRPTTGVTYQSTNSSAIRSPPKRSPYSSGSSARLG